MSDKFAFSQSKNKNLNEHITKELDKLLELHTNEKNVFNAIAYRKAINVIKNFKEKITNYDQIKNLKFIGSSISKRVYIIY